MLSWGFKVLNMSAATRPTVLSISWGGGESNYPVPSMQAANTEFQKMALLGISVFAASGDDGTGKQGTFRCKAFDATYPASSPYVTAVGGTYLDKDTQVEHGWYGKLRHHLWGPFVLSLRRGMDYIPWTILYNALHALRGACAGCLRAYWLLIGARPPMV